MNLSKVTLNKTISARKLSKTGVPTSDPETTIPFGAIIERVERDHSRGLVNFRYLIEMYQCPWDMLASAVDGGAVEADDAEAPRAEKAAAPGATVTAPQLQFESITTNMGPASRAKVPGGWIVRMDQGMTFYPDPEHKWA
ncbi:MAG TPA: hypothetical protein VKB88_35615 [Bryobacteraceae bacterium]|nr:hypothetical protein [Bryobacteraceae bacterium]